jgi:hypothetical protein
MRFYQQVTTGAPDRSEAEDDEVRSCLQVRGPEMAMIAYRQHAEDNRVEYLINRGVGADAESQRKHRGHGERRIVTQLAEGINEIMPQGIHQPEYGARVAASQRERSTRKDNGYKYQYF